MHVRIGIRLLGAAIMHAQRSVSPNSFLCRPTDPLIIYISFKPEIGCRTASLLNRISSLLGVSASRRDRFRIGWGCVAGASWTEEWSAAAQRTFGAETHHFPSTTVIIALLTFERPFATDEPSINVENYRING